MIRAFLLSVRLHVRWWLEAFGRKGRRAVPLGLTVSLLFFTTAGWRLFHRGIGIPHQHLGLGVGRLPELREAERRVLLDFYHVVR